jgi:hypothetical protein
LPATAVDPEDDRKPACAVGGMNVEHLASNNDAIASFGEKVRGMVDLVWVGGGQVRR